MLVKSGAQAARNVARNAALTQAKVRHNKTQHPGKLSRCRPAICANTIPSRAQ